MRLKNRILAALFVFVVLALGILHINYPLPYVYRVMAYRGPDYSDIHRFPASVIAASEAPSVLPVARDPRVASLFETHPDIEDFGSFLEMTDTTAFLVVHEGRLVEERYLQGHDIESVENTFSVAKSVTSALVGLAVRDGLLALDAPITDFLPELAERDSRFGLVTIENLLDMRSGIRYEDGVRFPIVNADDPLSYYFPDLESLHLERTEMASSPGRFQYNKYNPQLLGIALRRSAGRTVSSYLEQQLWQPLGAIGSAGWSTDDRGLERMESGFFARARDLARFGLMYVNGGLVDGRRVLPEDWVRLSTDTVKPIQLDEYDGRKWGYRLGWWIVPRPEGPSDFCAIGHFGQFIYVSPQHDAVFVRNGPDRGNWGDRDWTGLFYTVAGQL